ncbi:unnamed protein product [Rhizoctonia solani]|uniref:Pathogenesis-related protein 5 n=1 Tax=Rhizoctonia solani TaxID=456999 RepID=A0A8H2WXW7_9AGAM|nr:unnamed protein product [Rhizoctonia solani]
MKPAVFLAFVGSALGRTFTVYNACPFTIRPAVFTDLNVGSAAPAVETGWETPAWSVKTFTCDSRTGTGVPPASVAEWTLSASDGLDWYDVSLVDGYNLPMRITNNVGCPVADCAVDLGPDCPAPLKGPYDNSGFPVGCKPACFASLDGNQADSGNCCSGSHNTPATCPPSGIQYYDYFKSRRPNSYVYAYDESSGTALWTCATSKKADYTLTFCP